MRFRPYNFCQIEAGEGKLSHELREYRRTNEVLVVSTFVSYLDERREVIKRSIKDFLNECDESERYAFDVMVVEAIRRARKRHDEVLEQAHSEHDDASQVVTTQKPTLRGKLLTGFLALCSEKKSAGSQPLVT